jgi:hypothetical protein
VGAGSPDWDRLPHAAARNVTRLENEVFRKRVEPADAVFLDAEGRETREPTTRLLFRVLLARSEALTTLREGGLYAGDAGRDRDSGALISYFTHARLTKTPEMELLRSFRIDLTPRPVTPGLPPGAGRYPANTKSHEFHDRQNLKPQCKLDSIRIDHRYEFPSVEAALALGYDYCGYCFPGLSRR